MNAALSFLILFLFGVLIVGLSGFSLRENHGKDIRIVWYFVCLSAVITYFIAIWSSSHGAFSEDGHFVGERGPILDGLLKAFFDIYFEIALLSAIVATIIIPQVFSYFLSGLFGCASKPYLIDSSLRFFIWGVVKSFAVISGIAFSLSLFGATHGWKFISLNDSRNGFFVSIIFVSCAFFTLTLYRDAESLSVILEKPFIRKLLPPFLAIHGFLTRNERKA